MQEIEKEKLKLERQRLAIEVRIKRREQQFQLKQLEASRNTPSIRSQLLTPVGAAILAALVGFLGTVWNGYQNNNIESSKQIATERQERQKLESSLVLDAIKTTGNRNEKEQQAAANLLFLADAGFIKIPESKLEVIKQKAGDRLPSLPESGVGIAPSADDIYRGVERKTAKLSIGSGPLEKFNDLKDLIDSLPSEKAMTSRTSPITTDAGSGRVAEEQRNVQVRAFLYAASKEDDNDFHLVIGRAPGAQPQMYMTVVVSGLPSPNSQEFLKLRAARDACKAFFGDSLPSFSYDFYDPPIPLEIEGSLFFNIGNASSGKLGPASLKSRMPTIWEVHPVTKIVFEP